MLTPGVYNSAYFEHTLLAREMGVELVEGRDLICRNNRVFVRTTAGEMPVHVIYRRLDDEFLDPLQFRPIRCSARPGLINAARAGNLTIANAVGNGIADDKLVYTYVPDLIRYYLSEEPILLNVDTYRMEEPDHLEYALEHLDELVIKPVDGSGGKGIVIGSQADSSTLTKARAGDPGEPARLDRPAGDRAVDRPDADRRQDAAAARRPASVRRQRRQLGLGAARRVDQGRAARGRAGGQLSQGGGSKDTWVLAAADEPVAARSGIRPQAPGQAHGVILTTCRCPRIPADIPSQQPGQSNSEAATPGAEHRRLLLRPPVPPRRQRTAPQQGQQQQEQRC